MDLVINTGFDSYNFIDKVVNVSDHSISGSVTYDSANNSNKGNDIPYYIAVEAAAQLCAHHTRYVVRWNRHTFLLGIKSFSFSDRSIDNVHLHIAAHVVGHSESAWQYHVVISNGQCAMSGDILIGIIDYSSEAERELLSHYYQDVWTCFLNE